VAVVLWLRLPLVPVIVSEYVCSAVEEVVVMVRVDEPDPVIEAGEKVTFAPAGAPLALRFTVPLKPLCGVTVIV
jgi:hypothetical protein